MEITTPSVTEVSLSHTRYDAVVAKSSPESDPKRTNTKPLSFTNGVLKRQRHHIVASPPPPPPPSSSLGDDVVVVVAFKECLKNHAAALGGHALDGCGEFMSDRSVSSNPYLPISLKCSACGCHRNFHRREPDEFPTAIHLITPPPSTAIDQYRSQSHHLHQPLPLTYASPTSPSPPPISSSYYPSSAPNMLLALSTSLHPPENTQKNLVPIDPVSVNCKKRFRTKFSNLQKEKMYEVAERMGWKMRKNDDDLVNELCNRIGVGREVFKVWMHNNKSTFNKRSSSSSLSVGIARNANNIMFPHNEDGLNATNGGGDNLHHSEGSSGHVITNGSFSSS